MGSPREEALPSEAGARVQAISDRVVTKLHPCLKGGHIHEVQSQISRLVF